MSIRALAIMSLLAVFKDVIPGYRIRELTEAEESEKVREEVRRLRDGEAGLVRSYAGYLKMLEREVKGASSSALSFERTRRLTSSVCLHLSQESTGQLGHQVHVRAAHVRSPLQLPGQHHGRHRRSTLAALVGHGTSSSAYKASCPLGYG